jgi:hypothetical protein
MYIWLLYHNIMTPLICVFKAVILYWGILTMYFLYGNRTRVFAFFAVHYFNFCSLCYFIFFIILWHMWEYNFLTVVIVFKHTMENPLWPSVSCVNDGLARKVGAVLHKLWHVYVLRDIACWGRQSVSYCLHTQPFQTMEICVEMAEV